MITLVSIDCYKIMTNKMIVKITTLVSISTVWWTLGIKQQILHDLIMLSKITFTQISPCNGSRLTKYIGILLLYIKIIIYYSAYLDDICT